MKLYATITSERATKGQGGNKFLEIRITTENDDGSYNDFGRLKLYTDIISGKKTLIYHKTGEELIVLNEEKGEKQKGEINHPRQFTATDAINLKLGLMPDKLPEIEN